MSGKTLRELVEHLEVTHGVAPKRLAQACGIREATLKQYFYRKRGGLPAAFRNNLETFYFLCATKDWEGEMEQFSEILRDAQSYVDPE